MRPGVATGASHTPSAFSAEGSLREIDCLCVWLFFFDQEGFLLFDDERRKFIRESPRGKPQRRVEFDALAKLIGDPAEVVDHLNDAVAVLGQFRVVNDVVDFLGKG